MKSISTQRGYTLLFAVLVAVLVLGVAVFITDISRKQLILAGDARESMYSLYAADSGIECAAFAKTNNKFGSSTGGIFTCDSTVPNNVTLVAVSSPSFPNISSNLKQWSASFPVDGGECVAITFTTGNMTINGTPNVPVTIVDSRGYNMCTGSGSAIGPNTSNPQTVERALRLTEIGNSY